MPQPQWPNWSMPSTTSISQGLSWLDNWLCSGSSSHPGRYSTGCGSLWSLVDCEEGFLDRGIGNTADRCHGTHPPQGRRQLPAEHSRSPLSQRTNGLCCDGLYLPGRQLNSLGALRPLVADHRRGRQLASATMVSFGGGPPPAAAVLLAEHRRQRWYRPRSRRPERITGRVDDCLDLGHQYLSRKVIACGLNCYPSRLEHLCGVVPLNNGGVLGQEVPFRAVLPLLLSRHVVEIGGAVS